MWLLLEDVKHGEIHIRTNWLTLTTEYSNLKSALYESQQLSNMSSALLIIYIDSATNLKQVRTSTKPDPYIQIQVGKQIKTSNCVMRTVNPVWEQGFIFMVANPDYDCVHLKIYDAKTEAVLSEVNYNISDIYDAENLEIKKESLRLEIGRNDCKLIWSLHLKVFRNDYFEEYLEKKPSSRRSSVETIEKDISDSESVSSDSTKYSSHKIAKHFYHSNSSILSRISQEKYGDINLTIRYSLHRQRLIVVVHRIYNLFFEDPSEDKDIYVKLYLLPERCKSNKRKTKVIKNCREPTFNKHFEFLVAQDDLNDKHLEVSVIEEKVIKNEVLGQVLIDLKNISLPTTRSFELGPRIKFD